ncbi:MAG: hypothetical protein J6T63_04470 [Bacteroidales bacterium]|nr:hypothetical protein [Bacteroidales bacterium]
MQNIDFYSRSGIENSLWEVGLNIHNFSHDQRLLVLESVSSNLNRLLDNDVLNFVSYVLHSYTIQMDDAEKRLLVRIIMQKFAQDSDKLGEGIELLAILVKGCPNDCRSELVELITNQSFDKDSNPSRIISYANAVRYVFDEIDSEKRCLLYNSLRSILHETRYVFLKPTIQYTLSNIKTLL